MPLLLRSEEHTSELQSPCNLVCLFFFDRKSTRLNSSHLVISYAVFCLKKKINRATLIWLSPFRVVLVSLIVAYGIGTRKIMEVGRFFGCFIFFFFLMIRRPPRSTPLSLHDALPISWYISGMRSTRPWQVSQPTPLFT